ncbi:protease complex subunit PrcB family protein [Alicyclobacillus tolerans]|uniref:protease complex subunit PrcB family protein n=1 Tax=Alicyclobacillus tolerans TaxID=90970 RepID=UPI001F3FEDBD|nr:protease complex subunit PrcB family protein [Alicyclobacillus tolerans]MCF8566226.1 protease complex subunit PrcB family protein [Alicyclobacillus tolerans]
MRLWVFGMISFLMLAGCGQDTSTSSPSGSSSHPSQILKYQKVDFNEIPTQVENLVRQFTIPGRSTNQPVLLTKNLNGKMYIFISRGLVPTSGYDVSVTKVAQTENNIVIYYKFTNPKPGEVLANHSNMDYTIVVIPMRNLPVVFVGAAS